MAKPKVISLLHTDKMNNLFLNVPTLGQPANVFVQCTSYDLKLPLSGHEKRVLDIFEETILKMIKLKKCSISELADILCMEKDLVNFIVTRLSEKGLLKDNYTLSEVGEKQLDEQRTLRDEVEYQAAKLFIVNGCDIVLPYIYVGDFVTEDVVDFDATSLTLGFGSIGTQKRIKGICIREKNSGSRLSILPQITIKNAINKYNRLAAKRKLNNILLADDYGIESTRGEDIYFHMQTAVQMGNAEELLVSDGFVSNIDGLFGFIKNSNPDLIMRVKSKAIQMNVIDDLKQDSSENKYVGKYPEVVRYNKEMEKYIHPLTQDSQLDDIRQSAEEKRQAIINCYSMLEWSFHYFSLRYPISDAVLQIFKTQKTYENFETIKNFSKKIGLGNIDNCINLLGNFDGNRAEMIYRDPGNTIPSMQMALPMSIVSASEYDDSELKLLISHDSRFISFINYVGKIAADLRHDSTVKVDDVNIEEMHGHAIDIIQTILSDIDVDKSYIHETDHISNERLLATVECEKALGSLLFTSLDDGIQADFRRISPDKDADHLPAPYEFIQILYRILQTAFYDENKRFASKRWLSKEECIKKDEELLECKLPKSIVTVRDERYNAARRGYKMTLGTQFLVLISCLPHEKLDLLKKQNIVHVVDSILEYRKHANDISLILSWEELSELRGSVIYILKILGGYYNGQ